MEPIHEALELLKRQAELETGLRQAGGIRITESANSMRCATVCSVIRRP